MNGYSVEFVASALKELDRVPVQILERALRAARSLGANPRPRGSIKLKGWVGTYRLRVGDYRVLYEIDDAAKSVLVTHVLRRDKAYD